MKEIKVSGKHLKLRVVLFIVALVVGLSAFGVVFYQLSNRAPGYYEVTAVRDETAPTYASGIRFYCYLNGKSGVIKSDLKEAETVYSESLGRISRLLDPYTQYEGYVNLATLNQSVGEPVELPEELYAILTEAAGMDELRAGVLHGFWQELLYLSDAAAYDPSVEETQRERFTKLAAAVSEPDSVRLEIVDASRCAVRLVISDALRRTLQEQEAEYPVVHLDLLGEAYRVQYVAQKLIAAGFLKGYLSTDSGLWLLLPETERASTSMYGLIGDAPKEAAALKLGSGSAGAILRSFAIEETAGYYTVNAILRHRYLDASGEPNRALLAVSTVSPDGNLADAVRQALRLFDALPAEEETALRELDAKNARAAMLTASEPQRIRVTASMRSILTPTEENGYSAE